MPSEKVKNLQAFIKDSGTEDVLHDLQNYFAGKKFIVSDVYDDANHQYVDLVQEGGGVWGVALLGFTYIMEKMNIRFFSLAGTSAGSINTMLLAATGNKEDEKVERIIKQFLELEMFSFVDGKESNFSVTKWIKKVIQKYILRRDYIARIQSTFRWLLDLVIFFTVASFVAAFVIPNGYAKWVALGAIIWWAVLILIIILLKTRLNTLLKTGYGLNSGNAFHKWMTDMLAPNNIHTLADLKTHFSKTPPNLHVRRDELRDLTTPVNKEVVPPSTPMLTIITSDIFTGNKIEFPRMWNMYWKDMASVKAADFVRASMSIPIFFETFNVNVEVTPDSKTIWKDHLDWKGKIPGEVRFVDGGALSNFPINVFYNPDYVIPRMPTIGIRLGVDTQQGNTITSIGNYVGAIISTLRSSTDKDFLIKNKAFELGIKEVDMSGHSWLNFFMDDKEKQLLFFKGAEAAANFLKEFDWENYKTQRLNNFKLLQEQRLDPNNWKTQS